MTLGTSTVSVFFILVLFIGSHAQICPGAAGCLDTTFNGTGKQVIVTQGNGTTTDKDAAIQSDGKIVSLINERTTEIMLIRLNTDGSLDTTFGVGGLVRTNWHFNSMAPSGFPYSLAIQVINGEERLVVAGSWTVPLNKHTNVTKLRVDRYLSTGVVDPSFGTNGTVLLDKPYAGAVTIQPTDNKIVTVGYLQAVVRLNEDGSIDPSFGPNGDGTTGAGQDGQDIMVLPTGRILIGGSYASGQNTYMCVSALNPNGSIATDFGSDGRALADFYGRGSFGRAFHIGLDGVGNIISGGIARRKNSSLNVFAGARFLPNGQPDTLLNGTGMVTYAFAGFNNIGYGIAAQNDGKLLLTGSTQMSENGPSDWALVRFNLNGSLDTTFGNNGYTTTDFGGSSEYSRSVRIWTDPACSCQKIVMVGGTNVGASFARYTTQ